MHHPHHAVQQPQISLFRSNKGETIKLQNSTSLLPQEQASESSSNNSSEIQQQYLSSPPSSPPINNRGYNISSRNRNRQPPFNYMANNNNPTSTPFESRTSSSSSSQQRNKSSNRTRLSGIQAPLRIPGGVSSSSSNNNNNNNNTGKNMPLAFATTFQGMAPPPPPPMHDEYEVEELFNANSAAAPATGVHPGYEGYGRGGVGPHEISTFETYRGTEHANQISQRESARQNTNYAASDHQPAPGGSHAIHNTVSPMNSFIDPYRRRSPLEVGQGAFPHEMWDMPTTAVVGDPYFHHADASPTNLAGTFQFGGPAPGNSQRSYQAHQPGYPVGSSSGTGYPIRMMGDPTLWDLQHAAESGFFEGWMPSAPSHGVSTAPPGLMQQRPTQPHPHSLSSSAQRVRKPSQRKSAAYAEEQDEDYDDVKKSKRSKVVSHSPIAGENRLKIAFISYGTPGETPQHFGTKGYIIPDGLSGTHEVYHQRWKFEILHRRHQQDSVVITWNITNLASGSMISRTETPREARVRETSGHTICNQLLRTALKSRAKELELSLEEFKDNPTRVANTWSLIKVLQPKSCILGLLFFGLLHETVQEKMREINPDLAPITPARPSGSRDGDDDE